MENFYINEYFDWRVRRTSQLDRILNLPLTRAGVDFRFNTAALVDRAVRVVAGRSPAPVGSGISTNIEQRMNMYHFVSQVVAYGVDGDVGELGCNEGQSAVLIQRVISDLGSTKVLHLYDSFEGLPSTAAVDGSSYQKGDLATTEDVVRANFHRYALRQPVVHRGWFSETLPTELPESISFAHLDGDLYDSISMSLRHVSPRLAPGAVCLVADYCDEAVHPDGWNHLPGVKKACDEFLHDKPERVSSIYSGCFSHGFFRKL